MKIKIMDSIEYIDEAFKRGINKSCFFENVKNDFLMHMQGYSYIDAPNPSIEDDFFGDAMIPLSDREAEERKKELFGNLPVNDSLIQILKYALIKSYDDRSIPGVETFEETREAILYAKSSCEKNKLLEQAMIVIKEKELLIPLLKAFVECRYRGLDFEGEITDEYDPNQKVGDDRIKEIISYLNPTGTTNDMEQPIMGRIAHFIQKKNIDKQVRLQERSYRLGNNLYAMFRQIPKRFGIKEGVLIKSHPFNKKFKLLAVSETEFAIDTATSKILGKINDWFFNLDPKYYEDVDSLRILFQNLLQIINFETKEEYEKFQSSISVAIVAQNNTLLLSLGHNSCIIDGEVVDMKKGSAKLGTPTCKENIGKNIRIVDNDYDELLLLNDEAHSILRCSSGRISKPKGYTKELRSTCIAKPLAAVVYAKRCK